jgi:protein TonB
MAFDAVLTTARPARGGWRRITVAVSVALHVVLLAVGLGYSLWRVDELPLPTVAVTLAGGLPPPPPPPPPAAKKHTSTGRVHPKVEPTPLQQPREQENKPAPKEEPDETEDEPEDGAVEGGVAGGVKGGVVGGVVGAPATPAVLTANVARAQLLIDPNAEPYKVRLPPALARGGDVFNAIVRVCVSVEGTVSDVKVLRGADPAVDPQIPVVLRRWRYRPYQENGRPRPFCYLLRYEITAR